MTNNQCVCKGPMSKTAFIIIFIIILILIATIVMLSFTLAKDWNCPKKTDNKDIKDK